jgi:hypothetical protein
MPEDPIKRLLRKADLAAGPPNPQGDLVEKVFRLARRREAVTRWAVAAGIVLALGAGLMVRMAGPGGKQRPQDQVAEAQRRPPTTIDTAHRPPADQTPAGRLRAEIASLRAEADSRASVVEHMLAAEQRRKSLARYRQRRAWPDPGEQVERQMDRAALAMVFQADRMSRQVELRAPAMAIYHRTIELFPESRWADVARQRLDN